MGRELKQLLQNGRVANDSVSRFGDADTKCSGEATFPERLLKIIR